MDRRAFLAASTAAAASLAGCSGGGGGDGGDGGGGDGSGESTTTAATSTAPPKTVTVETAATVDIRNFSFLPQVPKVAPGDAVAWKSADTIDHRVVSGKFHDAAAGWEFDSGTLTEGDAVAFTFEETGVYEFFCSEHGCKQNCGAVLVGDAALEAELPCNTGQGDPG